MPTPIEILTAADKAARAEIDDFGLAYHVKPNALMAGNHLVNDMVGAVLTLNGIGQGKRADALLPLCPKLKQRTLAGLPLIVSNRNDAVLSAVLVGKPEILINPETPTR